MPGAKPLIRIEPIPSPGAGELMVRRRGVGHPDALCDALAEAVALALARYYLERFGEVLPHAVDQVTLVAGEATPRLGGGTVTAPMQLHLFGHAVQRLHAIRVPLEELVAHAVRRWLRDHLRGLDADRHVRVYCHFRAVIPDPSEQRAGLRARAPVHAEAHAPLRPLETLALCAEQAINSASAKNAVPALGEDVEIVAMQTQGTVELSAWCRFVDAHLRDEQTLADVREAATELLRRAVGGAEASVHVNEGIRGEELTVTGTRAESARGGASGCSQSANGLFAFDAAATGLRIAGSDIARDPSRLYQLCAGLLAESVLGDNEPVTAVRCRLLALPGDDLVEDARVTVELTLPEADLCDARRHAIEAQVRAALRRMPELWRESCGSVLCIDGWPLDRAEPDPLLTGGLYAEARAGMLRAVVAAAQASGAYSGRPVLDADVLAAIEKVPRHLFVPPELRGDAYLDKPVSIGEGQTVSQPFVVALMTDLAGVTRGSRVLEVGTGSGYQSAVLAELGATVHSIERIAALAERARRLLQRLGHTAVRLTAGDGRLGWPEAQPFDAVLVTAASSEVPDALLAQLRPGGRLVMPLADTGEELLTVITRHADGSTSRQPILPVSFVPLLPGIDV